MRRTDTRVIADLQKHDELLCSVCEQWKLHEFFPARGITARYSGGGRPNHIARCGSCQKLHNDLRRKEGKRLIAPTLAEMRAALGRLAPAPTLNTPAHPKRPKRPGTPRERTLAAALYRERINGTSKNRKRYVYCIGMKGNRAAVKVGITDDDARFRLAELQTGNPWELRVLGFFAGTEDDEKRLHVKYIKDNMVGEWFRPSPALLSEFDVEEGSPLD